uniref:Secreted protein n=1 Tax=Rhizochromulina marina TaxID=1034831 RepID=A0A7S2W583_9STRA
MRLKFIGALSWWSVRIVFVRFRSCMYSTVGDATTRCYGRWLVHESSGQQARSGGQVDQAASPEQGKRPGSSQRHSRRPKSVGTWRGGVVINAWRGVLVHVEHKFVVAF